MEVQSELGKGSEFIFYIEFLKDQTKDFKIENIDLDTSIEKKTKYENLNILVAEDDLIGQKIIKNMLEKNKWKATLVSNGEEALEEFNNHSFDMILMDIHMPKMNGFKVAKKIREIEKQRQTKNPIPIITLTAAYMKEDKEKYLEIGIDEYISKPIRENVLYKTIIRVLNKSTIQEHINIEKLLDRLDGDEDMLKELIKYLINDDYEKEHLGNIKKYLEEEDFTKLGKQIHKLKGSISNFGADNVINILEKMKLYIKDKDLNKIVELYKKLEMEFEQIKRELEKYYKGKFSIS